MNKKKVIRKLEVSTLVKISLLVLLVIFLEFAFKTLKRLDNQTEIEKNNQVSVFITLNPKSRNYSNSIAYIDITNTGTNDVWLDKVSLELPPSFGGEASFIEDTNSNQDLEDEDRSIGFFDKSLKNDIVKLKLSKINKNVKSDIKNPQTFRFFLESTEALDVSKVRVDFIDQDKKTKFNPIVTRFIDDKSVEFQYNSVQSANDFFKNNPQFRLVSNGDLIYDLPKAVIGPGSFNFEESIIIPTSVTLQIAPGTHLRFGKGQSLLSYSPVVAIGTPDARITFGSVNQEPWGVFAIVATDNKESFLENIVLENASPVTINNASFSGGLSAYNSNISLKNSLFRNNHGDDGVNIKNAKVLISRNIFANNDFDGLDLDVVSGTVSNNIFENNGNDGLDVSFNKAVIKNNTFGFNKDKCISIGEKSTATIAQNKVEGCWYGIAVKDQSHVEIRENTIIDNTQGVAVYVKKAFYDPPSVTMSNNIFESNKEDIYQDETATVSIND